VAWSLAATLSAAAGTPIPPPSVRSLKSSIAVPTPLSAIVASFSQPSDADRAELVQGLRSVDGDTITSAVAKAVDDSASLANALASVVSAPTVQSGSAFTGVVLGLIAQWVRYKYKQPVWADLFEGLVGVEKVVEGPLGGQWLQVASGSLAMLEAFTAWSRDRHRPLGSRDGGLASSPLDLGAPAMLLGEANDLAGVVMQAAKLLADVGTSQVAQAGTGPSLVSSAPSPPGFRPATDKQRVADFCAQLDAWQAQLDALK